MISTEERQLFAEAVKKVKPLIESYKNRKKSLINKLPLRQTPQWPKKFERSLILDDLGEMEWVSIDDILRFHRSGLQTKLLKKLSKGQLPIEGRADLHRMSVTQALNFADDFIKHCQLQALRHVLIIHGKGIKTEKPILKNAIYAWLKNNESVLALHSAQSKDGGTGALYVLIKLSKVESL